MTVYAEAKASSIEQAVTVTLSKNTHLALVMLLEREELNCGLSGGERKALAALKAATA